MAIISRIANKTKFETGDVPTQTDFIDLLDSVFMLQTDTLENINNGTNRKWVTPTQINTWDAKANASHSHAISDVTALADSLAGKQKMVVSTYMDASALSGVGNLINLNGEFNSVWIDCDATGMSINNAGVKPASTNDEFLVVIHNVDASPAPVTINFKYIDLDSGGFTPITAGGIVNVPSTEYLILKGSFLIDGGNDWCFVGDIKQTPA